MCLAFGEQKAIGNGSLDYYGFLYAENPCIDKSTENGFGAELSESRDNLRIHIILQLVTYGVPIF